MRKKGSITVFLVLVLVLMFSLVLTTLEAARIAGGRAYVQMLSVMAGDSARALYYYPLFKEYGLLGVLSDKDGYFSEDKLENALKEDVTYALFGLRGGLLSFDKPVVTVTKTNTMLSDGAAAFLAQVRELAMLEGAKDLLSEALLEEELNDAVYASQIYGKQEEALAQTATVTQEFLRLMELVDGVVTEEEGLCFDKEGNLQTTEVFIKRICSLSEEELAEKFKNEEVYRAVRENFYSPVKHAEELLSLMKKGMEVKEEISAYDRMLKESDERRGEVAARRDELIEWLDIAMMDMEEQYVTLQNEMNRVIPLLLQAEEILAGLENKQWGARLSVKAYEEFLKSLKEEVSEELYAVFFEELQRLKLYSGLSDAGYQVPEMRREIEENRVLLEELSLPDFTGRSLYELSHCVEAVAERVSEYSVESLWFTYGTIAAVPEVKGNVFRMLDKIATGSVLSLAGLSSEEISDKRLWGQDLPSSGLSAEDLQTQILGCFEEIAVLFQTDGLLGVLKEGAKASADALALEWYAENYFGCFGQEREHRKLSYEREYLLFGDRTDRGNLFFSVLYLVAVRTIFAMTMILKDAGKMAQLDVFAMSTAGFTGMPVLVSAVKYGVLLLWAVEEAFVEVAVLLDGKRVPLLGQNGQIAFSELFFFGSELVKKKAVAWKETPVGLSYGNYLVVLSVLKNTEKKAYRSMDLIQENIRCRYRDGFRMRNIVAGFSFEVQTRLEQKINTEIWEEKGYEILVREAVAF